MKESYLPYIKRQKSLLSEPTANKKTAKSLKNDIFTYSLFLSSYKQNAKGKNLCPMSGTGKNQSSCFEACIDKTGNYGQFKNVKNGLINKSNFFIDHKDIFMKLLFIEIKVIEFTSELMKEDFCIRLNGTTDIIYENIPVEGFNNIFEAFPNIQFYDYTKVSNRFNKPLPANYHLTFSRSEVNHKISLDMLRRGFNVSMIFINGLPKTYEGYNVINGDETDLRYLDPENCIVGLKYKNATFKGAGIVNERIKASKLVIDTAKLQTELELI